MYNNRKIQNLQYHIISGSHRDASERLLGKPMSSVQPRMSSETIRVWRALLIPPKLSVSVTDPGWAPHLRADVGPGSAAAVWRKVLPCQRCNVFRFTARRVWHNALQCIACLCTGLHWCAGNVTGSCQPLAGWPPRLVRQGESSLHCATHTKGSLQHLLCYKEWIVPLLIQPEYEMIISEEFLRGMMAWSHPWRLGQFLFCHSKQPALKNLMAMHP